MRCGCSCAGMPDINTGARCVAGRIGPGLLLFAPDTGDVAAVDEPVLDVAVRMLLGPGGRIAPEAGVGATLPGARFTGMAGRDAVEDDKGDTGCWAGGTLPESGPGRMSDGICFSAA